MPCPGPACPEGPGPLARAQEAPSPRTPPPTTALLLSEADIELLMQQASVPREAAEHALRRNDGDAVLALMDLFALKDMGAAAAQRLGQEQP